ncbi:ciliary-associated calcium-binding coiled-coil protein 1 isoform X3 [Rhinolophus sinicus]|uniref:ciliary-associated calcium-binding coiled-coil protein 1 isoform X3 n=1 Tax=Rhinolophus sinicus TaxID=89399 RepID=UPI003D7BCBD9
MAIPGGTIPGGTTPAALTPVRTSTESERDDEFQEHEKILSPDFLSVAQITELLAVDVDGVQRKLETFLNFKNIKTCLKEAILLDYYVSGFLWARGMDFSIIQYSQFMTLLDMLLHNLKTLHMSLEDSIKWLGEVMAEIGPSHLQKNEKWNIFDIKQANAIIDYLQISLFQHYKLYEFLFFSTREEIVIGTEGLDQEEGPKESQPEASTSDTDPLAGFTIEDIKSVLGQVTDDILIGIQTSPMELSVKSEGHSREEKTCIITRHMRVPDSPWKSITSSQREDKAADWGRGQLDGEAMDDIHLHIHRRPWNSSTLTRGERNQ